MIDVKISHNLNVFFSLVIDSIYHDNDFRQSDVIMIVIDRHLVMYFELSNTSVEIHLIDESE